MIDAVTRLSQVVLVPLLGLIVGFAVSGPHQALAQSNRPSRITGARLDGGVGKQPPIVNDSVILSSVEILAAGTTGDEKMSLVIDEQIVAAWTVAGDPNGEQIHSYLYYSPTGLITADQVRVEFLNDLYEPDLGIDRNLRIDAIYIDGVRFDSESPDVFSTGTWNPDDGIQPGFRESEWLHTDGYFQYANLTDPPVGTRINFRARGQTGDETIELRVNDVPVYQVTNIDQTFQNYYYRATDVVEIADIKVAFTNDENDNQGYDRALIVDFVRLDGIPYQTEAPTVYSTGTYVNGVVTPGFVESQVLDVNGYFHYGQIRQTEIVIRALGETGNETMELQLDELTVQTWENVSTEFQEYTFLADDIYTPSDIRVAFVNDLYDPENGIDYNLRVDHIRVNGVVYETEDPSVYSTGTWSPDDGIQPGFRESEWLHANGYFQYADPPSSVGSFGLSLNYVLVNESDGVVNMQINRIGGSNGEISVDYATIEQTAIDGDDYIGTAGTAVFVDGELSKTITIDLIADGVDEEAETFAFALTNPQGGAGLLSPRTATIEIVDVGGGSGTNGPGDPELDLTAEILVSIGGATAIEWTPDGSLMFIADFGGRVLVYDSDAGQLLGEAFVDISDQVNAVRGLLDIAVHPDFENNPYVYLAFAYDPPEVYANTGLAGPDGAGNRASRLIRLTADINNDYKTAVAGSEFVLLGSNSTWEYFNAFVDSTVDLEEPPGGILPDGTNVRDFLTADSQSHTLNAVEFGPDGNLYVANGDGASYNAADRRAVRVQDLDNLSGKILRIDPITGQGLSDNPFYDGDSDSNRSKVYQYGLRNPFRITFDTAGQIYIGDVGWTQWEEINAGEPGANFGWPFYEGGDQANLPTIYYRDLPEAIAFYATNPDIRVPLLALEHANAEIDALILGSFYTGDSLPPEYDNGLIFNHLATGFVRLVLFDINGNVDQIRTLTQGPSFMTQIVSGPDGNLYFVDFGTGDIGRWTLANP